jgi:formylglycine-generating enzyme required for sulfatase activity
MDSLNGGFAVVFLRLFLRLFLVLVFSAAFLCCSASPDDGGCAVDDDCRTPMVCMGQMCVVSDGSGGAAGSGGSAGAAGSGGSAGAAGSGGSAGAAGSGGSAGAAGMAGDGGAAVDAGSVADSGTDSGTPVQDMAMPEPHGAARDMEMPAPDGAAVPDAGPPRPAAPCGNQCPDLDFVALSGGGFSMGGLADLPYTLPAHQVNVPDFELMRAEVTVRQYRACVTAGACDAPDCTDEQTHDEVIVCNYSQNRNDHPVNYVSWINARQFATWVGARLPSESEWEYAAKSRGQNINYPWGDAAPTCDHADFDPGDGSCGGNGTSPVCTHAAGNSADGLCDLAGNVHEWTQDQWHDDYNGAPGDGSAWGADANNDAQRVLRGGIWNWSGLDLRAAWRTLYWPTRFNHSLGFRLAFSAN